MVVLVDLDSDGDELSDFNPDHAIHAARLQKLNLTSDPSSEPISTTTTQTSSPSTYTYTQPTQNNFSTALACYPVALSLAPHLDLNDLYSLSLTSKSIHASLLQFRSNLITHSLRCTHDAEPLLIDLIARYNNRVLTNPTPPAFGPPPGTNAYAAAPVIHHALQTLFPGVLAGHPAGHPLNPAGQSMSTGKIRHCARDLVNPCRRCGKVVCRNCAAKPPSDRCLKERFRRLCKVCLEVPLEVHLVPDAEDCGCVYTPPVSSKSSVRSVDSGQSNGSNTSTMSPAPPAAFTNPAFLRDPCHCETAGVYLCGPCGQNLRAADTTYKRVWTWRSRYSTHIGGGLGTGLGEGDQGQKCGRGEGCLEACKEGKGMCWVEIDCSEGKDQDGKAAESAEDDAAESSGEVVFGEGDRSKPGYLRQEVVGIGGVVKKKVKKRVKVGATVWEYDDERESGKYLEREATGEQRSWCGWCSRLVLGRKDEDRLAREEDNEATN